MMTAARLTSSLLARKGEAKPSIGMARPAAPHGPVVEILVPARAPEPAPAGAGHTGPDDRAILTVRIDRALHVRLRVLAARQRRTNQDIVEGALEAYLSVFGADCTCMRRDKPKD
jgi:hypothetical protein